MKKAIVTIAAGSFQKSFTYFVYNNWQVYANKYDLDVVIIEKPIDDSPRAAARSLAWQKCLIFEHPDLAQYDQVAWVDSDILINTNGPDIFEGVPLESVAAVEAGGVQRREDLINHLQKHFPILAHLSKGDRVEFPEGLPSYGRSYHADFGLTPVHESVVQSGVMVLSKTHHRKTLLRTYETYEDKGDQKLNYEMRPLSHELQESHTLHWLDPRFNVLWALNKEGDYRFMFPNHQSKLLESLQGKRELMRGIMVHLGIKVILSQSFFLHFAGTGFTDIQYYDLATFGLPSEP